tara:strand:- start:1049 stop:1759 length:711 start_codon:yes stop_codon:yes gene_type:complete
MVSVDTVYQKVLAIANKEQRGYITPQEFNLFANQVQQEILDQYFYDINQFGKQSGNDTEYSDMLSLLQEKMSELEVRIVGVAVPATGIFNHRVAVNNLYKLGSVHTTHPTNNQQIEIEQVNNNEWYNMQSAPLTRPTLARPVYVNRQDGLNIYPVQAYTIDWSYTRQPAVVQWAYVVVNDKALYNPNLSVDFELHASDESELVYRILALAGIAIKQPSLLQSAVQLEGLKVQQEKI